MTAHQYDLLLALSKSIRTLRSFTHAATLEQIRISPHVVELNLGKLVDAGYVKQIGSSYGITGLGMKQLDLSTPQPRAAISAEAFKGTRWNIRRGGEDHAAHRSFGTLC